MCVFMGYTLCSLIQTRSRCCQEHCPTRKCNTYKTDGHLKRTVMITQHILLLTVHKMSYNDGTNSKQFRLRKWWKKPSIPILEPRRYSHFHGSIHLTFSHFRTVLTLLPCLRLGVKIALKFHSFKVLDKDAFNNLNSQIAMKWHTRLLWICQRFPIVFGVIRQIARSDGTTNRRFGSDFSKITRPVTAI